MGGSSSKVVPKSEHPRAEYRPPGRGAPVLTGVRVVELATVVAAPTAGRAMALLGAEVVKIEEPGGDPWRKMLRDYEKGRQKTYGTLFEVTNLGKSSVVLDLKNQEGLDQLEKLLAEADVFLTNLRPSALQRLKVDYETLSKKHPRLIFAHLTASQGLGCDYPGYDIGSFWARTGMGAAIAGEGSYTNYPTGFGDTTTGMAMLGGILSSLHARETTGRGALVDGCLLRSGAYMMQAQAVDGQDKAPPPGIAPNYQVKGLSTDPTYAPYRCKDSRWVTVLGGDAAALGAAVGASGELERIDVQRKVIQMSEEEFTRSLQAVGVPSIRHGHWPWNLQESGSEAWEDDCFLHDVQGVKDIDVLPGIPMKFSCSELHGQRVRRAPLLGEHTTDILQRGFGPRPVWEGPEEPRSLEKGPLGGVIVFQVDSRDACVASVGTQLGELGADVLRVKLPKEGSSSVGHTLAAQLNRNKTDLEGGLTAMRQRLSELPKGQTAVVVLGTPFGSLEQFGCLPQTLREDFPEVVVAAVTPRGLHALEAEEGYLGWWLKGSGFTKLLSDEGCGIPDQLGALVTSVHLATAVCAGIFHHTRTGEGQIVDVSYLRSGVFANHQGMTFLSFDPVKERMSLLPPDVFRRVYPIPTCHCHITRDGYWIQLLGVDMPRHLKNTLKSLDLGSTFPKVGCGLLCCCACNCCKPTLLEKLEFMFEIWNLGIEKKIGEHTRAELAEKFKQHDVWWADINMPCQMLQDPQLAAIGAFTTGEDDIQAVKCPAQVIPG
eukprot:Hpha_TRINITY_DN15887_c0_g1::TRINITY_DN15887_c0_g1_i1::g.189678::m.189678